MSTFGTNTQIIQEDGIGKESWFDGGILKRSGPIVRSETRDVQHFIDNVDAISLFWVQYIQVSDVMGRSEFDNAEIILHMRLGFTELTGVSQFIVSSDVSFARSLYRTVFDLQKSLRLHFTKALNPLLDRQELTNRLLGHLNASWHIFEYPLLRGYFLTKKKKYDSL